MMTRLPDIEVFKLFGDKGLVTEMRKAVTETQATLEQLHELAETLAGISVNQIKGAGRWGAAGPKFQGEMIDTLIGSLRTIGMEEPKIQHIIDLQRPIDRFDYFHHTVNAMHKIANDDNQKAWRVYSDPFIHKGSGHQPDPNQFEVFLKEQGLLTGEVAERLADYKQYWTHGTHRRKQLWDVSYREDV
ncbi:hypothetical protein AB4Z13_02100 [Rhizobium sp. YAF28]|uniref:hypothetical protein n=1 Tax=Rhizobium sp. YAF28 TaxID=3233081 RepID=UPI003F99E72D